MDEIEDAFAAMQPENPRICARICSEIPNSAAPSAARLILNPLDEDSFYQIGGNRKWKSDQLHTITAPQNDLIINLPDGYDYDPRQSTGEFFGAFAEIAGMNALLPGGI